MIDYLNDFLVNYLIFLSFLTYPFLVKNKQKEDWAKYTKKGVVVI